MLRRIATASLVAALVALPAAAADAAQRGPLVSTGTAVTGATSRVHAPLVGDGVRLDVLGGVGAARQTVYYLVHRQRAESTLHVSVTTALGAESDQVSLAVLTADGARCASDSGSGTGSLDTSAVIAASVVLPESQDAGDAECARAGDFVVRVDHGYPGSTASGRRADVPIELRVQEEPPVRDVAALPADAATPIWRDPDLRAGGTAITGGTSLNGARVTAPGTYSGSIRTGESQVFAVPVDFGQSLAAAVRVEVTGALATQLSGGGIQTLSVRLLSPSRADAAGGSDYATDAAGHANGYGSLYSGSDGEVVYGYTDAVAYRNRYATADSKQGASHRGRYLVVVSLLDRGGDSRAVTVPFVLGVAVRGDVAGVPDYTASDTDVVDDAQQGAGGDAGIRQLAGTAAIAAGVLAVLAAVAVLVRRSRRQRI